LIVLGIASSLIGVLLFRQGWGAALLNLGTEFIGAVAVYFVFELIIERVEARETEKVAIEDKRAELITRMGSDEREVAVTAVNELRRRGWLTDGSLRRADLKGANLLGARVTAGQLGPAASLEGATLPDGTKLTCWLIGEVK
jgi:hypothetical protein